MPDLRLVATDAGDMAVSIAPIRVVLVEDHTLLRDVLRLSLDAADGIEVIAEADDMPSALRLVHRERPHVLVLDLGMMGGSSRDTIARLRARAPGTRVVLLSLDESPVVAQHVLASGVLGYVLKDRADDDLAPGVRAAARGEEYISPRVAERLDAALRRSFTEDYGTHCDRGRC